MKKKVAQYIVLFFSFVVLLLIFGFMRFGNLAGFVIFSDSNSSSFNSGTFINTSYNGSAVVLDGSGNTGTFTSRVFDAGQSATWNNISFSFTKPTKEFLFAVDASGAVYYSADSGVNWVQATSNYGRGASTQDMFSNDNYLYIIFSGAQREIWRSGNFGTTWSVINNSFTNTGFRLGARETNGNIYVTVANGEIYRSTNNGQTWSLMGDANSGASGNPKGISINSDNNIFVVDGSGGVFRSTNSGVTWTTQNSGYGGTSGTDDMGIDNLNVLYILFNKAVYKSSDSGVSWLIVTSDFGTGQDGLSLISNSSGSLFIVDSSGDVFKSTNAGTSWGLVGDFNGGATNDNNGLTTFVGRTNLTYQFRNCSSVDCSDGSFVGPDGTGNSFFTGVLASVNKNSRYFQYKVYFSSDNPNQISSYLSSSEIDYSNSVENPQVQITVPTEGASFTSNNSLVLNFSVVSSSFDKCWYSLNGGVTNTSISGCGNTTFGVASSGSYTLFLFANSTTGGIGNDSVSFVVDSEGVSLQIVQPSGTKDTRTGILIEYVVVGQNLSCWYNVKTSVEGDVIGNTTLVNCDNSTFSVSADGNYLFNLFANNSLGSRANVSSIFSVDTSVSGGGSGGGSSGGGSSGGGGGSVSGSVVSQVQKNSEQEAKISFSNINEIVLKRGERQTVKLEVVNNDLRFLNNCKLKFSGVSSNWLSNNDEKGLSRGEKFTFNILLNIPSDANPGEYSTKVIVQCDEGISEKNFLITTYRNNFEPEILDYERSGNTLKVDYNIKEFAGEKHQILLSFELLDFDNIPRFKGQKVVELGARESLSDVIEFTLPKDSFGEFNFVVKVNDGIFEVETSKVVFLPSGSGGLTGLVVSKEGRRTLSVVGVLIIIFVVVAVLLFRAHKKKMKKINFSKPRRKLIELDL